MAKKKSKKSSDQATSFEQALGELESIVHELEHGELDLADALKRYELGVKRLRQCQSYLEHAEHRIEFLTGVNANGDPVTKPAVSDSDETGDDSAGVDPSGRRRKQGRNSRRASGRDVDVRHNENAKDEGLAAAENDAVVNDAVVNDVVENEDADDARPSEGGLF